MKSAKVNGVELEYEVTGSGEPVLLISPVPGRRVRAAVAEPALADRYQLIRYHKRGWVGSTHTPPPVTVADHAADAAALLDHLGMPRAHVAGHSSGAAVASSSPSTSPRRSLARCCSSCRCSRCPPRGVLQKAGPAFEAYAAATTTQRWPSS